MKHDIKNLYDDVVPYICALAIMGLLLAMGLTIVSNVTFRNANVIYRVSEKGNFYGEVAQAADAAMSKVEEPDSL